MSPPARSSLLAQDRFARAAWSRVAEPGDVVAAEVISALGPVVALQRVAEGSDARHDRFRPRLEVLDVERDLEVGARFGARLVCPGDDEWPRGLDDLEHPPYCLWVRGPLQVAGACRRSAAVVGARSATAYGEMVATDLAAGLAERGFTIVSGAAFGIDAAAHRGALAVGGDTIAVLAGGVERAYPAAHATLIGRIADSGAVISEVAPGSAPTKTRFLQRNRLIATMSAGTVVVEAGLRSGSLNTARRAADHARVVAAVPGPVTSMMSAGCHQAVRDGYAVIVTDAAEAADVFGVLGHDAAPRPSGPSRPGDSLGENAARVLAALPLRRGVAVSRLVVSSGLAPLEVASALGQLELKQLAERHGEGWRARPG
jgi:DNA processing protein